VFFLERDLNHTNRLVLQYRERKKKGNRWTIGTQTARCDSDCSIIREKVEWIDDDHSNAVKLLHGGEVGIKSRRVLGRNESNDHQSKGI